MYINSIEEAKENHGFILRSRVILAKSLDGECFCDIIVERHYFCFDQSMARWQNGQFAFLCISEFATARHSTYFIECEFVRDFDDQYDRLQAIWFVMMDFVSPSSNSSFSGSSSSVVTMSASSPVILRSVSLCTIALMIPRTPSLNFNSIIFYL